MKIATAKEVGLFIRSRREELGWTQGYLCSLAGTRQPWLSEVEKGTTNPELGKVLAILRALGVAIDLSATRSSAGTADRPPSSTDRTWTPSEKKSVGPVGREPAVELYGSRTGTRSDRVSPAAAPTLDRVKVDLKAHMKRHLKVADGD